MRVPAPDAPLAQMPSPPKGAEWAAPARVIDRVIYRIDGGGYIDPGYTQVFVVAADGGAARQVTQGKHNFMGTPAWTRDGKRADRRRATSTTTGNTSRSKASSIASTSIRGAPTRLTERKGPDHGAVVSPDGKRVAWLGFDDNGKPYQGSHVYVHGSCRRHAARADAPTSISTPTISAGTAIAASSSTTTIAASTQDRLGRRATAARSRSLADDFGGTAMGRPYSRRRDVDRAAGRVAYTRGSEYRPADVAIVERGGKSRALTDLNANLLGHKRARQGRGDRREIVGRRTRRPGVDRDAAATSIARRSIR